MSESPNSELVVFRDLTRMRPQDVSREEVQHAVEFLGNGCGQAEDSYWASVFLEQDQEENHDREVLLGLNRALQGPDGLTFSTQGEMFVDAVRRYARLLFKYKQWLDAKNFLILANDLGDSTPGWVQNYLAKLLYETDPKIAFSHPEHVLEKLEQGASQAEFRNQARDVFREFMLKARNRLDHTGIKTEEIGQLPGFVDRVQTFLETHRELASSVRPEFEPSFTERRPAVEQRHALPAEVAVGLRAIEDENESLRQQVEEKDRSISSLLDENIRLYQEIDSLQSRLGDTESMEVDSAYSEPPMPELSRIKLLVLGASQIGNNIIHGIVKGERLDPRNVDIYDFEEAKRFNVENLRFNSKYHGILVGPIAHKVVGLGDYSSLLARLEKEEGFPAMVPIRQKRGKLKISKTSFKEALAQLLVKIGAIMPEVAAELP